MDYTIWLYTQHRLEQRYQEAHRAQQLNTFEKQTPMEKVQQRPSMSNDSWVMLNYPSSS